MKKLLLVLSLTLMVWVAMAHRDRTGFIKTGYTMLSEPMVMTALDSIYTGETTTFLITNLQKFQQHQVFSFNLTSGSGSESVVITAYGRVTSTSAWVAIGSAITWTADAQDGDITSTTPINYNYFKIEFVAGGSSGKTLISSFVVKTSNAADIPANSGTYTFARATTGTITLTSQDADANCALTIGAGGTGAFTLGDANSTSTIASSDWAISATGIMTGMGAITSDGLITATGGVTLATTPSMLWAAGGSTVTAASGTDVAFSAGARYWVEVNIPYNKTITGAGVLLGSVGGTDSLVIQLCNSAGVEVATTRHGLTGKTANLAGTTAAFQDIDFVTPYAAVAGRYFIVLQTTGTTAKFRAYAIPGLKCIANTAAGTWGTKANITPGTTFVADKGPISILY